MADSVEFVAPGESIGPYRVLKGFRGRGGMARVYEVEVREKYRQPGMPRRLALKVADEAHQSALVTEADYLSRFDHPNVVHIFPVAGYHRPVYAAKEHFTFGWRWYYAMELLEGGSLELTLTRASKITDAFRPQGMPEQPLPLAVAWGIARQLAEALVHIHTCSVLNLDIKPGNILFRRRFLGSLRSSIPWVVLSDFGIARDKRIPRFGELGVATPEYVSPEHAIEIHGGYATLDERSDIFSLGVVLYEILTGQLPFDNIGMIMATDRVPVPPRQLRPGIPQSLEQVILRALSKDPAVRYQTALEMRAALEMAGSFVDWGVLARRVFLGVTLAAGIAGGWYGASWLRERGVGVTEPTDVPTEVVIPSPIPVTPLHGVVDTPEVTVPIDSLPTSTPRPTSTPTLTPRPTRTSTGTPALTPGSGG